MRSNKQHYTVHHFWDHQSPHYENLIWCYGFKSEWKHSDPFTNSFYIELGALIREAIDFTMMSEPLMEPERNTSPIGCDRCLCAPCVCCRDCGQVTCACLDDEEPLDAWESMDRNEYMRGEL